MYKDNIEENTKIDGVQRTVTLKRGILKINILIIRMLQQSMANRKSQMRENRSFNCAFLKFVEIHCERSVYEVDPFSKRDYY